MKLILEAKWDEIEKVRNASISFLHSHKVLDETVQALTMVIGELMENAIKYGRFTSKEDKVTANISIDGNVITVEVVNPVDERANKNLKRLDRIVQWIRGYQDSFQAYVERMQEISIKPLSDEESGLGLVRISYEGKSILDFFVSDNNLLNVSAVSNFRLN